MEGYYMRMSVQAVDTNAYAKALYPSAKGGTLYFDEPEERFHEFEIGDFLYDDQNKPIGIITINPDFLSYYAKPFEGYGLAIAEIRKEGKILATLEGLQRPKIISHSNP